MLDQCRARGFKLLFIGVVGVALAGCRADVLPNPTVVPTVISRTITPSPSPTLAVSLPPSSTFIPIVTATPIPTQVAALPAAPTSAPTTLPSLCRAAKQGDTIVSLLSWGGYADLSAAASFRALNNMTADSNAIIVGQTYCIPRPTPTPIPVGYADTLTAQPFIPTTGAMVLGTYTVKDGDSAGTIESKTGVALSLICKLNPLPDGINCAGCDLNAAIFQAHCRPVFSVGKVLKIPGPTPTPTITPTLTGSETATPTLAYVPPSQLAPINNSTVTDPVRLEWLPNAGLLGADEVYMVLLTDSTDPAHPINKQYLTQATSVLIPSADAPQDAAPHMIYWQVSIARVDASGKAILLSANSPVWQFTWARQG